MVTVGDVLRYTVTSEVNGQDCLNVDFKTFDVAPPNPLTMFELARDYHARFYSAVQNVMATNASVKSVLVENLTDGISFAQYDDILPGLAAGEAASSFVSIAVRLNRSTKLTRNGYKRIAGLSENQIANNEVTSNPLNLALIEALYANTVVMDDLSNPPDTYELGTVIVGRTLNMSGVYELDLTKINPVITATVLPKVTSQVSRKEPN